jgi:hypothetical protein
MRAMMRSQISYGSSTTSRESEEEDGIVVVSAAARARVTRIVARAAICGGCRDINRHRFRDETRRMDYLDERGY